MIKNSKILPFLFISVILHIALIILLTKISVKPVYISTPIDVSFYSPADEKTDIHTTEIARSEQQPKQLKSQEPVKTVEPEKTKVQTPAKTVEAEKSKAQVPPPAKSDIKVKDKTTASVKEKEAPAKSKASAEKTLAKPEKIPVKQPEKTAESVQSAKSQAQTIQAPASNVKSGEVGAQYDKVAFDSEDFEYSYYKRIIVNKISRFWEWAETFGTLSAIVYFKILKDGSVNEQSIKIVKTSGNVNFDENAKTAIMRASPFGDLPETYKNNSVGVYFEFKHG